MLRFILALIAVTVAASPGYSETQARLEVAIADGDPHDRIYLTNLGGCKIVSGTLVVDFTASRGKIIIDTQYGGVGTKDPMPVEVETGLIALEPVSDGARELNIHIAAIPPGGRAVVTLDMDNDHSVWFARRVSILSNDLENTVVRFAMPSFKTEVVFGRAGQVAIDLPSQACERDGPADVLIPIS